MPLVSELNYESVTVAGTAIGFDATDGTNGMIPEAAVITVETAAIRFRTDGTNPTASEGHSAEPGDVIILGDRKQCAAFRAIRRDGVSATIRVSTGAGWR